MLTRKYLKTIIVNLGVNCYIFKIFIIFAIDLHLKYGIRPINC